jgi:hypothetical protein
VEYKIKLIGRGLLSELRGVLDVPPDMSLGNSTVYRQVPITEASLSAPVSITVKSKVQHHYISDFLDNG